MTTQDILSALLAFILGLLAKFLYDLWVESRQKKSIVFTKKVINTFSISTLGEKLRDRAEVLFDREAVKSVHIVSVEVENAGLRAVKNQAFTVRFGEEAKILGAPVSKSSSEDLRFVEYERVPGKLNAYRFIIHLLQKERKLAWEFVVVNTDTREFMVEHGISSRNEEFTDTDLDVGATVVSSKIQLDLISQIKRTLLIAFSTAALLLLMQPIVDVWGSIASLILRALAVFLFYLLFIALSRTISLYAENRSLNDALKAQGGVQISIGDISEISGTVNIAGGHVTSTVPRLIVESAEPPAQVLESRHRTIDDDEDTPSLLSESSE